MQTDAIEGLTQETFDMLMKAVTNGVTVGTGIYGYDLRPVVSQIPANTPVYDRIARRKGKGSQGANWNVLLNVNNLQPNPFVGADAGGNFVQIEKIPVFAPYQPVRVSGQCTRDSIDYASGYSNTKNIAAMQTLMQWRILDNKGIIGGQAYPLAAMGTVTLAASATGGTIAASTAVHVRVAARSPYNFYWGGSGAASTDTSVTTGSTGSSNSVTATWPSVQGAAAYDIYVAGFYVTTTTVNTYTVTAVPTANAANPPKLPALYATAPTAVPTTDTSYSANAYNGLIAGLAGDYTTNGPITTPGSGQFSSGASFTSLDGGTMTADGQGVKEVDTMLTNIFNIAQLSPTVMVMNAQQAVDLGRKVLGTPAAVLYLDPNADRSKITAGGMIGRYINKADGGSSVGILVDPAWPTGSISFLSEVLPYPDNDDSNTFEVSFLRDIAEYPYGAQLQAGVVGGGPRDVWDQSSIETLIDRAPVACGHMQNIAAG